MRSSFSSRQSWRGAAAALTVAVTTLVVTRSHASVAPVPTRTEAGAPDPARADGEKVTVSILKLDYPTSVRPGYERKRSTDMSGSDALENSPTTNAAGRPTSSLPTERELVMLPESDARPALGFMVAAVGLWETIRRFRKSWISVDA